MVFILKTQLFVESLLLLALDFNLNVSRIGEPAKGLSPLIILYLSELFSKLSLVLFICIKVAANNANLYWRRYRIMLLVL